MIHSRSTGRRLALSVVIVFVVIGVFVGKLVDIQVVRAAELNAAAEARRSMTVTLFGSRGNIVDANGTVLADSVDRFDITASPRNVGATTKITIDGARVEVPTSEAIAKVAELTGASALDLTASIDADRNSDFTYLVKAVTLDTFKAVFDLDIPWIYSELRPSRTYPNGAVAGNLVGFLGTDEPLAGIERRENACLAGHNGTATFERGADGVRLPGSLVISEEATDGSTIHLTIDADLQWFVQQKLAEQATAIGADWATAMLVRVNTGEIVVAADWPAIDPNDLNSQPAENAGARSFTAPFEPGSIMKPVTFAALLDQGLITPSTPLTIPNNYKPPGSSENITDSFNAGNARWTATGVLMHSSNIGTVMLGEKLSPQQKYDYFRAFGFGELTEVDFLGEEGGLVRTPAETKVDPATLAAQTFGQGITATSAQMVSLYQTLGNGGVRLPLTLVAGCEAPDGTWTDVPVPTGERVVSEYAATTTLQMMESVATDGPLARTLSIPGYRIAAKTGTGEVAEGGRYGSERIVSVAAVFPADNPQYALVVTLGKPDTMKTSAAAAPVVKAIMEQVIKTFRITPSTEPAPNLPLTW